MTIPREIISEAARTLWTRGLICAVERVAMGRWVPIGWKRIRDLWLRDDSGVWWCHVNGDDLSIKALLKSKSFYNTIGCALEAETKKNHQIDDVEVICDKNGLRFEVWGQSVQDEEDEDCNPTVLRVCQSKHFLVTCVNGTSNLSISEFLEDLVSNRANTTIYEVIAKLVFQVYHQDDRLIQKLIFEAVDNMELKLMDRKNEEDLHVFRNILDEEMRKLHKQAVQVKLSLKARDELIIKLCNRFREKLAINPLERIRDSTREMLQELELVRGRLFTLQNVLSSTIRVGMQDQSAYSMLKLTIGGTIGLVLWIVIRLFGVNLPIPFEKKPYAFYKFLGVFLAVTTVLIVLVICIMKKRSAIKRRQKEERKEELNNRVKKAKTRGQAAE